MPKLVSASEGDTVTKFLEGLRTALLAAEYARSPDRDRALLELARVLAKGDPSETRFIEAALKKAEQKQDTEVLADVHARYKDLLENEEALSKAKTLEAAR